MREKYWQHKELFDGTYTFSDLWDIHEHMDVEYENAIRKQRAIEREQQNG